MTCWKVWRQRKCPRRTESSTSMELNGGGGGGRDGNGPHDVMISEVQ